MNWLNIFTHLLPNARAWRITSNKRLRQFFEGLTVVGSDAKGYIDRVYQDLDPQKTRSLDLWEDQFNLSASTLTVQQRRDRLAATWKALGGQDPYYIQNTLRAAGFDVYVHEWWEPVPGRPTGGSINGDHEPVARNPYDFLNDGLSERGILSVDGAERMQDGGDQAFDGAYGAPQGYPLVNKLLETVLSGIGDGAARMQDGAKEAIDGTRSAQFRRRLYPLPTDPARFPYFLYIGGEIFPNVATVPSSRRDEFEDLCLKICPLEQWLGILVRYS